MQAKYLKKEKDSEIKDKIAEKIESKSPSKNLKVKPKFEKLCLESNWRRNISKYNSKSSEI